MARISPLELVRAAANLALDKKAEDAVILDLRRFSLDCDYFLIASGTSDPHVRGIADWIEERLGTEYGEFPWHREGAATARWVLLDYVDVVLHIFRAEVRETYMLERLWGDAPVERIAATAPAGPGEEAGRSVADRPGPQEGS
jgi:ribosome-associated protein